MSGTKRIYNKSNKLGFSHPYHEICCGNCKRCKDLRINKRKRNLKKSFLKFEFGVF